MKRISFIQYAILVFIGIGLPLFVVFRNIYPHFSYALHQTQEFGLGFTSQSLAGQDYLVVALGTQYPFDTTDLKLTFDKDMADSFNRVGIELAKDYLVNTYPIGEKITDEDSLRKYMFEGNPEGLANGSVYAYGESVFVVSRGKYYPVIAPVVFESLGYHWEQVLPLKSSEYAQLSAADKINYMTAHPDGTLLRTKAGKFFLVWEGKRLPVSDASLIEKVWKTYYWVDIAGENIEYFSNCQSTLKKSGKYSCAMKYEPKGLNGLGDVYIMKADPAIIDRLQEGKSVFETSLNWEKEYLKFSLGQIKNKLYTRYAGYFL